MIDYKKKYLKYKKKYLRMTGKKVGGGEETEKALKEAENKLATQMEDLTKTLNTIPDEFPDEKLGEKLSQVDSDILKNVAKMILETEKIKRNNHIDENFKGKPAGKLAENYDHIDRGRLHFGHSDPLENLRDYYKTFSGVFLLDEIIDNKDWYDSKYFKKKTWMGVIPTYNGREFQSDANQGVGIRISDWCREPKQMESPKPTICGLKTDDYLKMEIFIEALINYFISFIENNFLDVPPEERPKALLKLEILLMVYKNTIYSNNVDENGMMIKDEIKEKTYYWVLKNLKAFTENKGNIELDEVLFRMKITDELKKIIENTGFEKNQMYRIINKLQSKTFVRNKDDGEAGWILEYFKEYLNDKKKDTFNLNYYMPKKIKQLIEDSEDDKTKALNKLSKLL